MARSQVQSCFDELPLRHENQNEQYCDGGGCYSLPSISITHDHEAAMMQDASTVPQKLQTARNAFRKFSTLSERRLAAPFRNRFSMAQPTPGPIRRRAENF